MKITIGFSPCPNDTFIFDALVNKKIDTGEYEFEPYMEDVQTLNEWAISGKLDISKISYATLPLVLNNYNTLPAGSALGQGVGPLLISKIDLPEPAIRQCTIGIPGQNTTANLLFSIAFPEAVNKVFMRYDEVENFVLSSHETLENIKAVKLGVIIHENRFTYEEKGLKCLIDLGEYWEKTTALPIPLGGIIMRREFDTKIQKQISHLIRKSTEFSFSQYPELSDFIRNNAQEMDENVMREHINLYVNDYTLDIGEAGRKAILKFLRIHSSINKIDVDLDNVFI